MAQPSNIGRSVPFTLATDLPRTFDGIKFGSTATTPTMKHKLSAEEQAEEVATPVKKKKTYYTGKPKKFRRKECVTCCNQVPVNRFPKLPHKTAEKHGRDVCVDCWEQHLKSEIETKGCSVVCCPLCNDALEETEIKKLAKDDTYDEWLDKAAKECRESDEEFRACPSAECGCGCFFSTKEDGNIFTCQLCKTRYCVICEVLMHDGETCNDYQQRINADEQRKRQQVQENAASATFVNETSKPCPKCTARLGKYTGCDHVTCRQCRHEFCWLCFAPYHGPAGINQQGNNAHKSTCRHYSGNLPNAPVDEEDEVPFGGFEDHF